MTALFRMRVKTQEDDQPDRPSHFREDQNEREVLPTADYPTTPVDMTDSVGFPTPPAKPTPVYLVEPVPSDRSIHDWSPQSITVTATPIQLIGADRRRTRMVVVNNDTDATVYLTKADDTPAFLGYPLAPGKDVELLHNGPVFAFASGGDALAPIGWFAEYNIEMP